MKRIILIFLCLASLLSVSATNHLTASWPTRDYIYQGDGWIHPGFGPFLEFEQDIIVTGISFSITNIPKGAAVDWGINLTRVVSPLLPTYTGVNSEILGLHASFHGSGGTWAKTVDLSAVPLYIPAHTRINCFAPIFNATLPSTSQLACSLDYHIYTPGEARYRSIRIPYVDQQNIAGGGIAPTWYKSGFASGESWNLQIGGFIPFVGFNAINANASASSICVRQETAPGSSTNIGSCYPTQSLTLDQNYQGSNIVQTFTPNWFVAPGQYITGSCQMNVPGDCGIYVFVKLRDNIASAPAAIVSGYDFVPRPQFEAYCDAYAAGFTHPWFGTDKVAKCKTIFGVVNLPTATPAPTNTPAATSTPTPTTQYTPQPTASCFEVESLHVWVCDRNPYD